MSSTRATFQKTRHAWRLLGAARELRSRPAEQAAVLVDGLGKLFGADNGFQIAINDYRPGGRLDMTAFHYGSVVDPTLDRWLTGRLGNEPGMNDDIMAVHTMNRAQRTTVLTQSDLWPRLDHRAYPAFAQIIESYKLHDNLVMMFRPGRSADSWGMALHRRSINRPYTAGDRQLAKALMGELRLMHDSGRLTATLNPAARLPPRTAQVLDMLLTGESPKQIAGRLALSVHTVRDHVKLLLERFGVSSTQELLALFLKTR